jgi:hypothetical protein
MYCIQEIHLGMESNLLYNPLNVIKGNNRAGAIAEDL